MKRAHVARVRDQHDQRAALHAEHAADRQREDVIQRQRADDDELVLLVAIVQARLHPHFGLQHVRDDVAMEQRRALRHTGRAAGVLQERDVVRSERDRLQRALRAGRQRVGEACRVRHFVGRDHLLDVADHEVRDGALREAEQVADAGHDDLLQLRLVDDLFERRREVLEDDDRLGARVVQLMLELARRVQRVDVHDDAAGPQDAEDGHRVLQHVRHHDGDPRAGCEPPRLQPRRELRRHAVELVVRDALVHADERVAVAIALDRLVEQLDARAVAPPVDLRRHPGRIVIEPRTVGAATDAGSDDGATAFCARCSSVSSSSMFASRCGSWVAAGGGRLGRRQRVQPCVAFGARQGGERFDVAIEARQVAAVLRDQLSKRGHALRIGSDRREVRVVEGLREVAVVARSSGTARCSDRPSTARSRCAAPRTPRVSRCVFASSLGARSYASASEAR